MMSKNRFKTSALDTLSETAFYSLIITELIQHEDIYYSAKYESDLCLLSDIICENVCEVCTRYRERRLNLKLARLYSPAEALSESAWTRIHDRLDSDLSRPRDQKVDVSTNRKCCCPVLSTQ